MGDRFVKEFEVLYHEANRFKEVRPLTIVEYLEDTAIAHSEQVGLGIDQLKTMNVAWVLNRWDIRIEHYPLLGERVFVETWPSSFERFYAKREFILKDQGANVLGHASSLWVYLNMEKMRPVRVPEEFKERYGLSPEEALPGPFLSLEWQGNEGLESEAADSIAFKVRRSDIDTNGHVNNAKYVEWLLESVPQSIYDGYQLARLEIAYKRETHYGSIVRCACREERLNPESSQTGIGYRMTGIRESSPSKIMYLHSVTDEDAHTEVATGRTTWRLR